MKATLSRRTLLRAMAAAALPCVGARGSQRSRAGTTVALGRDRAGRLTVDVAVDSAVARPFVLDSGAARSALGMALVSDLGLPLAPDRRLVLRGAAGSTQVPAVKVKTLRVAGMDLPGGTLPVVRQEMLAGAAGILGVEGFHAQRLRLEVDDSRLSLARGGESPPRNWAIAPLHSPFDGLVAARADVAGVSTLAILDSGAERSLANLALRRALAAAGHSFAPSAAALSLTIAGSTRRAPDFAYGDYPLFEDWSTRSAPAIALGADFFGNVSAFAIDYDRLELQIQSTPGR